MSCKSEREGVCAAPLCIRTGVGSYGIDSSRKRCKVEHEGILARAVGRNVRRVYGRWQPFHREVIRSGIRVAYKKWTEKN